MYEKEQELVELLARNCETMADVQELIRNLIKKTVEQMLEAEMDEHLGYEKYSIAGDNSGNSRNGYNKKTVQTELGETELRIPRDRNGAFSPKVIEKYQTKTDDLESRIIAMYSKGMSNRDIEDHLRDIYGVEASASLISRITDKIMPAVMEWQSRPLDSLYPIVFLDGIINVLQPEHVPHLVHHHRQQVQTFPGHHGLGKNDGAFFAELVDQDVIARREIDVVARIATAG